MRHYFLTGGTGVVGSAVLRRLVDSGETVTVLLRCETDGKLKERVRSLARYCHAETALEKGQVRAVRGDVYLPKLGLNASDYTEVLNSTHIIHCAAEVNMRQDYEVARNRMRISTESILNLLEALRRPAKCEFVSTIGVGGVTSGDIPEAWILHPRKYHNSYEAAKSYTETLVKEKVDAGCPITVHRPSMVVGDSRTGEIPHFQVFYYLCEFLSGSHTAGFLPKLGDARLDIVPSDYVASLLHWSSLQTKVSLPILHSTSGKGAICVAELMEKVCEAFHRHGRVTPKRKSLPQGLFIAVTQVLALFSGVSNRRRLATLPIFLSYLGERQYFCNEKTLALVSSQGMSPPLVASYLDGVLNYYLANHP